MNQPPSYFTAEQNSRCCCLHICIGIQIVAALEFLGLVGSLAGVSVFYSQGGQGRVVITNQQNQNYIHVEKNVQVGDSVISLTFSILLFLFFASSIVVLLVGVFKVRPRLVLSHLVVQVVAVSALVIAVIVYALYASEAIALTDKELRPDTMVDKANQELVDQTLKQLHDQIKESRRVVSIICCVFLSLGAAIETYFVWVTWKCYNYIRCKRYHEG